MSRQGFACHSIGPIFDWIFRATFYPIRHRPSHSAVWFSSIQFPNETARHKRVSLLFYLIISFSFSFFFPPTTCSIFLLSSSGAGIYIIRQTDGRGSRVLSQIDFIITFYFLGDKLPAHFWTHFLCKLQRTFWPLKCPCSPYVCVSVCAYLVLHSFVVGLCDKFFI